MSAKFRVEAEEAGLTLAAVLRRHTPELPWSRARDMCERGKVSIDGRTILDSTTRVKLGAQIGVDQAAARLAPPVAGKLAFEDSHLVVLDKPSGISSVPYEKRESGTAMDLVRTLWRSEGKQATVTPLHVVHRIDKETSGLLAFAKTKLAERALEAQFRAHEVERTYLCVVHGKVGDRRIESRLVTDRGDGLRGTLRTGRGGKRAVTHVRMLRALGATTLCEVKLETGKTHQIRIHLAEDGHPLVGEKVYVRDYKRRGHEPIECSRLLLHAATLGFIHPISKQWVRLSSPLPPEFERELARLGRG